jgi:ABC-type lipoprotein release transport system permease subunit
MNPLSPFTYYRRHKRQTLLLMSLISLMTFGVCVMVGLIDSIWKEMYDGQRYLTRVSMVSATGLSLDAGIASQIRARPDVAHVIQEKGVEIVIPSLIFRPAHLFGVTEADRQVLMDTCALRLKEGRLPRPRTNEMVLSEEIVNAMGIRIGDQIGRSTDESQTDDDVYGNIPVPLELVGILEGTGSEPHIRAGFVSYEYVSSHELFESPWTSGLVVVAQEGRKEAVDGFLESEAVSWHADVMTHRLLAEEVAVVSILTHLIFGVVDVIVAVVIALVVGMINQIAQTRRLKEFGLLHTVGHDKNRLIRRSTLEMTGITVLSWIIGLAFSWALLAWLKSNVYEPMGMSLDLVNLMPIGFSIPVPLAATVFVAFGTMRTFKRFDAVAIVERGKLSMEEAGSKRQGAKRSSARPLSSWTFYLRHRRRGLILVVAMGLMILGVSFPAFLTAPLGDAMKPFAEHLSQIGVVLPRMGNSVDPGVAAQVRTHPSVDRVISATSVPMRVTIPLGVWMINVYGVSEDDLQTLVDLYGVQMKEGRLPRPHTNEIVLSEAAALNRGLSVGDRVGKPVNDWDHGIPTEMIVVGIFSRPFYGESNLWLGFASYEYLSSHELYASYPTHLLVIPAEGHKDKVDAWLQQDVFSDLTGVQTFERMQDKYQTQALRMLAMLGALESVVAIIAALALAMLSYTFFSQRREEFGVLHAMGHSRWWLVLRTIGETASAVAVAWLMGAVVCVAGLIFAQLNLYAPKGMSINFFDPTPWLFTLPMPVAVVAASAGLVALILRRLDPVAVIERR